MRWDRLIPASRRTCCICHWGVPTRKGRKVYRALFRAELDGEAIDDIRLALNQNQPIGNERFHTKIERMTGIRREARPRGRPRLKPGSDAAAPDGQGELAV